MDDSTPNHRSSSPEITPYPLPEWFKPILANENLRNGLIVGALAVLAIVFLLFLPSSPSGMSEQEKARESEKARITMQEKAREEEQARIAMQENTTTAIREVLDQYKVIFQDVEKRGDSWGSLLDGDSGLMFEFAKRQNAIDLSRCPSDFHIAFKRHVAASHEQALWVSNNYGIPTIAKGIITAGLGTIADSNKWEELKKNIRTTYLAVQESAIQYGVTP